MHNTLVFTDLTLQLAVLRSGRRQFEPGAAEVDSLLIFGVRHLFQLAPIDSSLQLFSPDNIIPRALRIVWHVWIGRHTATRPWWTLGDGTGTSKMTLHRAWMARCSGLALVF